ncbi:hypothetical protein ACSBR1_038014 [Camellia fascicularis]
MAEIAVLHLLANFAPFLQEEVNLLSEVQEDMEDIRDEFERMSAFLKVADAKEESDLELKVWIKQVRDAAYDTEDVLDKFKLHLVHHRDNGFGARHQIASEIQRIKSRVINISEGHRRYHDKYGILEQFSWSTVVNNSWSNCRGDALLIQEAKLVDIEMPKRQLMKCLVQGGSGLKAIYVVGMSGLCKTTLVKKVYDAAAVKKHLNSHAWLTVLESFGVEDLLKDMIRQLFHEIMQPVPVGVETMSINRLKCLANDFLQQRRYVVVFDDVWNVNAWEAIKHVLPDNNCGSRVILTTRFAHIASTCCEETDGHGNLCPPNLKKISHRILKRCEGLPLAIVVISGVLATKDKNRIDEWEMLYSSLGAELKGNDKLESMKKALSLSYNDLPYYLLICFLHLSIFPEDQQTSCERTIEEVANGYLDELFNRSLIQVENRHPNGRPSKFRIHDLMREIIVSKAREQNIVTTICRQGSRWPEKVSHLLIRSTLDNMEYRERSSRLCSLFVWGPMDSLPIASLRELFRRGSRLLKVLDLSGTPLETIPNEVFKLIHLRYLSLRNTKVKMVPKLIGKLENLETLDLQGTYVTKLPDEILRLQNCAISYHFILNQEAFILTLEIIEDGATLCSSIEKLSNLRRLDVISTKEDEILDLQSLSPVPRFLQQLYLIGRVEKFPLWIPSLHGLVRLRLGCNKLRDDPLRSLQELPNLAELILDQAYEGKVLYFKAGGFQRLKHLRFSKLKGLRWVRVEDGAMPHLETLIIVNSELMEEVPSGIKHLTNLQTFGLFEISHKLSSKLDQDVQDGDYCKIAHIPEVQIGYLEHGQRKTKFL